MYYRWEGRLACRICHKLVYKSQRERAVYRIIRRADKIRDRLGWFPGIVFPEEGKPKGMHWRTFLRLRAAFRACVIEAAEGMAQRLDSIGEAVSRIEHDLARLRRQDEDA